MNVRPLNDRILVKRLPVEACSSIIVTPEIAAEASTRGLVMAVGPGKRGKKGQRIPCDVKPGDVIFFGPYTDFDDGEHVMVQEADVRYVECSA